MFLEKQNDMKSPDINYDKSGDFDDKNFINEDLIKNVEQINKPMEDILLNQTGGDYIEPTENITISNSP